MLLNILNIKWTYLRVANMISEKRKGCVVCRRYLYVKVLTGGAVSHGNNFVGPIFGMQSIPDLTFDNCF